MVNIQLYCTLKEMKEFLVESTCRSFIPHKYLVDENIFPERRSRDSEIYIEAERKVEIDQMDDLTFVEIENVMGIIYNSKSGRSSLKWRQVYGELGKLSGEASTNTIVNLYTIGIKGIETVNEEGESGVKA